MEILQNKFRDLIDYMSPEKTGDYVDVDTLLKTVKAGDLIQFRRKEYVHWGMYVGKNAVIHLRNLENEMRAERNKKSESKNQKSDDKENKDNVDEATENKNNARIEFAKLKDVANNDLCRVNNRERVANRWEKRMRPGFQRRTAEEAVNEARSWIWQEMPYNLKKKNCEHVCTEWKYNVCDSDQVNQAKVLAKAAAGTALASAATAATGVATDQAIKEKQRREEEAKEAAKDRMNRFNPL